MTGLRTARGIDLSQLERTFERRPDLMNPDEWESLISTEQVIEWSPGRFRIPEKSWLFADRIASALFDV